MKRHKFYQMVNTSMKMLHDSNSINDCLLFYFFLLLTPYFVKVTSFQSKKTASEKAYVSALCRILVLLQFRISEQGPVKFMKRLLCRVIECASSEKDLVKELKRMSERLMTVDNQPDQELMQDEVNLILGNSLFFSSSMFEMKKIPSLW